MPAGEQDDIHDDHDDLDEDRDDEDDDDDEDRKKEKAYDEIVAGADQALDRWHQSVPEEARVAAIDGYCETGLIDAESAGVDPLEASIVQAAAAIQVERNVLHKVGLTMDQWMEHIDEAEFPAFRRAVIEGRWGELLHHAAQSAQMRKDLGI